LSRAADGEIKDILVRQTAGMSKEPTQEERLHAKDEADYNFIQEEILRICKLDVEGLMAHCRTHPADCFNMLRLPDGRDLVLTYAAQERFVQIAKRGLSGLGCKSRHFDRNEVVRAVKREFAARVLVPIGGDEIGAHDIFDSAIRALEAKYVQRIHFVPCSTVAHKDPTCFSIGPVEFIRRDVFWQQNEAEIQSSLSAGKYPPSMVEPMVEFYSRLSWIAKVSVPPCDPGVSLMRAARIVEVCLSFLKLLIGSDRASLIHHAYNSALPERPVGLQCDVNGIYHIRFIGQKLEDAFINDNWYAQATKPPIWQLGSAYIQAYWDNWDESPNDTQQRFIDGMMWHADAVSESDTTAKLVKYWSGMERVVALRRGDDVTRRVAVLLSDAPQEYQEIFKKVQRLYSKRSDVIHGTISKGDPAMLSLALETELISRDVIIRYLFHMGKLTMGHDRKAARKATEEIFRILDERAKYSEKLKP
jgi:Apea-like HEPN